MVTNNKKSAIQLNVETPQPESLQEIPRMDETTYKYLEFEMKGEVDREQMMMLKERIVEKQEEHLKSVDLFEARNWIHFINKNVMSIVRFYSGPVKFTLGWIDVIDQLIRSTNQPRDADEGCVTIPLRHNSATFSFNTILVFWFAMVLDFLPPTHSSRSRCFHRVLYAC